MLTWKDRIEQIKTAFGIKNNRQLEQALELSNGYINDLLGGKKNKNPSRIIVALGKKYRISPIWFYDDNVGMFGDKKEHAIKHESELILAIRNTENKNENRFSEIEERLQRLETALGLKSGENAAQCSDSVPECTTESASKYDANAPAADFTAETAPEYEAEPLSEVPYVEDIAAGTPIPQSEDQSRLVSVPRRLIKKGSRYYAASIRGGSMSEAGIRDGDLVLIRCADAPRDGAVQVVRYQGKSTLKRLREREGRGWELHYEDGSGRVIPVDSGDYQVQGDFVAVLPENAVPEGRK
jgi:repressor LexA